jgi:CheY-like chemotaxis protein
MPVVREPRKFRVLIVDDDELLRSTMGSLLEDHGCEVELAEDGVSALARLDPDRLPHVILLDLTMPRQDGWATVRSLQADERLRTIPVIVMTGAPNVVTRSGVVAAITKPMTSNELLAIVAEHAASWP